MTLARYLEVRKIVPELESRSFPISKAENLFLASTNSEMASLDGSEPLFFGGCGSGWSKSIAETVAIAETVERAHFLLNKDEAEECMARSSPPGDIASFVRAHIAMESEPEVHWTKGVQVTENGRKICSVPTQSVYANWLHHVSEPRICPTFDTCLLYTSPSPRDLSTSRMPSSA